jgi:hypothetical protein
MGWGHAASGKGRLNFLYSQPQGLRRVGQAPHRQVNAGAEGQGAMLLGVVERDALLQVGARRDHLALPEQTHPERKMGFEEERRVVDSLGQAEALLRQFHPQIAKMIGLQNPSNAEVQKVAAAVKKYNGDVTKRTGEARLLFVPMT